MERSTPGRTILLFSLVFLMLMIVMPLVYPYGSFTGLDGTAGAVENWSRLSFADPLTRVVYSLGDLFCHQEMSRSFVINGSQMAFCQRDVSILIGVVLGSFATDTVFRINVSNRSFIIAGIVMIASTFAEWVVEYVSDTDILAARILTGIIAGIGIVMLLQYAVAKEYEKVMGFEKEV